MSQLTKVTRVRTLTVTRRIRTLTGWGQVLAPIGQEVAPAHVVARGPATAAFLVLQASDVLKTQPERVEKMLLVKEGAELERGEPLLRKSRAFGRPKLYRSPADGTLVRVRDGCLVLQRAGKIEEVRALVKGRVVSIIPDRGVVIEAVGSLIQAVWDSGKSAVGRLQAPASSADDSLNVKDVGPEAAGSICIAGYVDNAETLASLEERGARGLIAGSMPSGLCLRARRLSFPIFLTEGIGYRPMAEPIFELLQRSEGRELSLLAESRAHRPQAAEIIIPLPTSGSLPQLEPADDSLQTGSLVRVMGLEEQTMLGRVSKLYIQPRRTDYGGMAAGADVVLADGRAIFVPYANLDLIG
ncbi:MAG: hypothetical protein PVH65_07610 [Chloroflexota bacterium]|jgi:hypothetical protein